MSDFTQRLIDEHKELKEKTEKLALFLSQNLYLFLKENNPIQGNLLAIQLNSMKAYLLVLEMRMKDLGIDHV